MRTGDWRPFFFCLALIWTSNFTVGQICAQSYSKDNDDFREDNESPALDSNVHISSTSPNFSWDSVSLDEIIRQGTQRSSLLRHQAQLSTEPQQNLVEFHDRIYFMLKHACQDCHGPEGAEGNFRIDELNPDLVAGSDLPWWLEVYASLSKGEMPPPDDNKLPEEDRGRIIDWLTQEIQTASALHAEDSKGTELRRMTRYEFNFALQDLLGLPFDFAKDLQPDSASPGGFENDAQLLHMTEIQMATIRESARNALRRAIVTGPAPSRLYWAASMDEASQTSWSKQDEQLEKMRNAAASDPEQVEKELANQLAKFRTRHGKTYYKHQQNGRTAVVDWSYPEAKYAWEPTTEQPQVPSDFSVAAILPPKQRLIIELGDRIPEEGTLRVRVRACRSPETVFTPSLQLEFGWQASNDSHASVRISQHDLLIDAEPGNPKFYQWDIALGEIYPRNLVRNVSQMGDLPSPSEYIKFVNSAASVDQTRDVQIDYVEVTAPVFEVWPPQSHRQIFIPSEHTSQETVYAKEILADFMPKAWRRPVSNLELEQKVRLFKEVRPDCQDFSDAIIEVLSAVLCSPKFLYWMPSRTLVADDFTPDELLASRLAAFLWCSIPDDELNRLAQSETLSKPDVLQHQVSRMLEDEKSHRFSEQFVSQWLGLKTLEYLKVDQQSYPSFEPALAEAMRHEPIATFHEMLVNNQSLLEFLHADFAMVNERLAKHYGIEGVIGNHMRRVAIPAEIDRGGLLTQAGILALNSDGRDSHPIKRGIWVLERLLDDPPPPPPPTVPRIDLADPEIAKLSLKQRLANHRDQAACRSCHQKIDPWGIVLEHYDAIGGWRNSANGHDVDATAVLFNNQELSGADSLKRYLLLERQDQFIRTFVGKLTTYAVGRSLSFADRVQLEEIASKVRSQGDGLATTVWAIVESPLFQQH
ncbi:MAG: DUF1592 domain-containing protein [Planctomycetales bacterium]|nr:DUF1592 domain-containing protein [Planctomycetales bacterium]